MVAAMYGHLEIVDALAMNQTTDTEKLNQREIIIVNEKPIKNGFFG